MDAKKRRALEADGWVFGDAQSFLGLTDAEMAYIDLALVLSDALKARRLERGLTQEQLAELLGSSQSRVAKMEGGHPSVTVDRLIKSLFAMGVSLQELGVLIADRLRSNAA